MAIYNRFSLQERVCLNANTNAPCTVQNAHQQLLMTELHWVMREPLWGGGGGCGEDAACFGSTVTHYFNYPPPPSGRKEWSLPTCRSPPVPPCRMDSPGTRPARPAPPPAADVARRCCHGNGCGVASVGAQRGPLGSLRRGGGDPILCRTPA